MNQALYENANVRAARPVLAFRCQLLLVAAMLLATGCKQVKQTTEAPGPKVDGEKITMAADAPQKSAIAVEAANPPKALITRLTGRLIWNDDLTVRVFSPVAGRVDTVLGALGQPVTAGTALARIASPDFGQAQADARRAAGDLQLAERSLNRIRELQFEGGAQASCTLCRFRVEVYNEPRSQGSSVLLGQHLVPLAQGSGEYFGQGDHCNRKAHEALLVCLENGPECRSELWMILQDVDDRRGVNKKQRAFRQPLQAHRFHSSFSRRTVARLSRPYNPRPLPARDSSDRWALASPLAETGINTATGRPCRVMMVCRPCCAAVSNSGN